MKVLKEKPDISKLIELIKTWKINMPTLAEKSGMKLTTFRNKIYHPSPVYFFTAEEYLGVLQVLDSMIIEVRDFIGTQEVYFNKITKAPKSKKLS